MARREEKKTAQEIAIFGESGSGKTVLASVFFGRGDEADTRLSQEYRIKCPDASLRQQLLQNYLGLVEDDAVPRINRHIAKQFPFQVVLTPPAAETSAPAKKLELVWHDYPGEWFEQTTSGPTEEERKLKAFTSLLQSDIAFLLVDAAKLARYRGEEYKYLKRLFSNFRAGIESLEEEILTKDKKLEYFPRIWIIALSKADILPDLDARGLRNLVVKNCAADIDELRRTLQRFIKGGDFSLGDDFLLLSSAKFEPREDGAPPSVDTSQNKGLDVIVPLTTLVPAQRFLDWQADRYLSRAKLDKAFSAFKQLSESPSLMASIQRGLRATVDRVVENTPLKSYSPQLAEVITVLATTGVDQLTEREEQARAEKKRNEAALYALQKALLVAEENGILFRESV